MQKFFQIIGRNFLARCSKLHFNCPEEHDSWRKKLFFVKCWFFFSFSDLEQIFFESFAETFRQLRENCNLSVHRNILKEKCFLFWQIFFFSFRDFERSIFELSDKIILSILSKTAINVSRGTICWKLLVSKTWNCSTSSGLWMKIFLNSCRKILPQLSKLYLCVLTTFTSKFFSWKLWKFFCPFWILIASASFLTEFSSAGFLKLHSTCQNIFSRKNFWSENFFFQFFKGFRIWVKNFRTYGVNCSAALSKLHFFRQRNKKRERLFSQNCINLYQFSAFRVGRSGPSVAIFDSFVKFDFFVSKETFWIKI